MADEVWTAQLHIANGEAVEDAPEIAFAERRDDRGRVARLFIVAEPDRPGSDQFIGELVSGIGEDFLDGQGSLTGVLQRALRQRHDDLLEWNRTSLPRDQASYGVSCLIVREGQAYLAQMGPCLVYYRQGDRLLRRDPTSERAMAALGTAETAAPEFSQMELATDDWVLLISSAAAGAIGEQTTTTLRALAAEDVLPALYPLLRTLPRVSALVVAPQGVSRRTMPSRAAVQAEPLQAAPLLEKPAPATPVQATGSRSVEPERDSEPAPPALEAAAASEAGSDEVAPQPLEAEPETEPEDAQTLSMAEAGAIAETGSDESETPQGMAEPAAATATPTSPAPTAEAVEGGPSDEAGAEEYAERTPLSSALGGALGGVGAAAGGALNWILRRKRRSSAWDVIDDDDASDAGEPPGEPDAARQLRFEETDDVADEDAAERNDVDEQHASAESDEDASAEDSIEDDRRNDSNDSGDDGEAHEGETGPGEAEARDGQEPRRAPNAETRGGGGTGLSRLDLQASGWPSNPFSPTPPPVLRSTIELDASQVIRPIFGLRSRMPNFRRPAFRARGRGQGGENDGGGWRQVWGPFLLGLGAMIVLFGLVAGLLLVPDLLEDSEQSRFAALLDEGRDGLTAATLASDPRVSRDELSEAQASLMEAITLRPLDADALLLQQEIDAALLQVNAIVQPAELVQVVNFGEIVAPPLALAIVQTGAEHAYVLDESGGRIFSIPLAGGEPELIFEAGVAYPLLFQFGGPVSAAPISMQWSGSGAAIGLTILDNNRRVYRYTPGQGVDGLTLPNGELLGSAVAVAADAGAVYVLDVEGGIVWRFPLLSDGALGPGEAAISRTDLTGAASLTVDGAIFLSGPDGRVRRFVDGSEAGFPLLNLDRSLLVPASLAVGKASGLLYAVDRGNDRVVVFTVGGELVAQLRDDDLRGVRGVAPDELNRRVYYVTVDALLTSVLPDILDR